MTLQTAATESRQAAPLERPKMAEMLGRGNRDKCPSAPAKNFFRSKYLKDNGLLFESEPRDTL